MTATPLRFAAVVVAVLAGGAAATPWAHPVISQQSSEQLSWARFRGPNGSGVAPDTGLPAALGPNINVVWKTGVPQGYSSPVLSAEQIFLTGVEDEKLLTIAVDRRDGSEVWRREAPRPRRERLDGRNHPAAPSAVTDGAHVVVFFAEYGLLAYDVDGNELWRLPLGPFDNLYGMGASPVIHDGRVFLVCDQRTGSFLIAVDVADGSVVWRVDRLEAASSHATPTVWSPAGGGDPELIVVGSFLLSGYDMATGERLWWVRGMIHEMKSVPVIGGDVVYVNGYGSPLNNPGNAVDFGPFEDARQAYDTDGDGMLSADELPEGRAKQRLGMSDLDRDGKLSERDWDYFRNSMQMTNGMFAIRLGGVGDMTEENFLWLYSRSVPQLPSPLLLDGILYMINDGGIVTILDPDTGERLDQGRLEGAVDKYYASPVAADGKIYIASELGKVAVLQPGRQIEIITVNDLDELTYATPAIADGRIYIRTDQTLYCFGME